jgi:hypothetical protein
MTTLRVRSLVLQVSSVWPVRATTLHRCAQLVDDQGNSPDLSPAE